MAYSKAMLREALRRKPLRNLLEWIGDRQWGRKMLNSAHASGVYANFEEAWARVNSVRSTGHEHPEAWKLHLQVARKLRPSDYPVLYALAREHARQLKVFDFGGSVGNVYYLYRQYLEEHVENLSWTVFDLPRTIEEGRRLAQEQQAANLRFTASCRDFTADQMLLASGSFHYWEGTVPEFIAQFGERPRRMVLNRIPVTQKGATFVTVQLGDGFGFPCKVWNEAQLIADFESAGYHLRDSWHERERSLHLPLFPHRSVEYYSGFHLVAQP